MKHLVIPCGDIYEGRLAFASERDWEDVLLNGLFHLKIPKELDCTHCVEFCRSFYLPSRHVKDSYRGWRTKHMPGSVLGYSNTGADQVEMLQIELHLWDAYLPKNLTNALRIMNDIGRIIVRAFFAKCGVKQEDVAIIAEGMEANEALQYGIFNHFESKKNGTDGFTPHKDSGFLQLMYIHEPGFEAWDGSSWCAIAPLPGHLTAVLGHSLEVLTEMMPTRVIASYHRVRMVCENDRTSFGIYLGPTFKQNLYQYDNDGKLSVYMPFEDFQRQKAIGMGYEFHPALNGKAL